MDDVLHCAQHGGVLPLELFCRHGGVHSPAVSRFVTDDISYTSKRAS
ncbi:hypothetical protein GYM67_04105 [Bifidobacterium asteroides]|nr:hypothetical protein [Bifidobacterium asteroides]QYN60338.1 hypothetical protein GYM67_04105 [Bifidobacterium asteroides]